MKQFMKRLVIHKDGLLILVCCIGLLIITLTYLQEKNVPYVLGDELGYWTSAAYFSGRDWSGIASINGYFSFGYGLLLMPLFLLKDPVMMYRGGILMNAFFLLSSFLLACHAGEILFSKIKKEIIVIFAFITSIYPSYLGYVQTNMAECLLLCLSWVTLNLLLSIEKKDTWANIILFSFAAGYAYMVHMRMLALVVSGITYLIYLYYKQKISKRKLWTAVVIILALVGLTHIVKELLTSQAYSEGSLVGSNDYTGQLTKIKYIFSIEGMKDFIISILGKIFYLGIATYTIFFWGIKSIAKKVLRVWKKEASEKGYNIYVYLAVLLVCTLGISSVFMVWSTRVDVLIYGRYNEHILGIYLLIGLFELFYYFGKKTGTFFILILLTLGLCITEVIYNKSLSDINSFNIMGIFRFICGDSWEVIQDEFMLLTVLTIVAFTVVLFLVLCLGKEKKYIGLVMVICYFLYGYFGTYIAMANGQYAVQNFKYEAINEEMKKEKNTVYCVYSSEKDSVIGGLWGGRIQFLNPDAKVVAIDISDLKADANVLMFVKGNSKILPIMHEQYQYIGKSDDFEMFRKE